MGFAITEKLRDAIDLVPNRVWTPAIDADGGIREGGDVAELTGLIDPAVLGKWPTGVRVIVRRERPHPGAQLYRFVHVPARLTHGARRRRLRIPDSWPWATAVVAVVANIAAIPQPA